MKTEFSHAARLLSEGKYQQAIESFEKLNKTNPDNSDILSALAYSYFNAGQTEHALSLFKRVTELQPKSANAWLNLAGMCLETNQLTLAEQYFKKTTSLDDSIGQAWHILGTMLFNQQRYAELTPYQNKTQQLDHFAKHINQAQSAISNNDTNQAKQICQEILAQHQRHPEASFIIAMLLAQQGKLDEAISRIESGLEFAPYNDKLRNFLSQLYAQTRFYSKAVVASNIIVQQREQEVTYWLLHADNLVNTGQYTAALNAYDKAQQLTPDDTFITLQKAHIHKALGNNEQCMTLYRECLAQPSTCGSAYWALSNLSAADLNADDLAQLQALQLDPDLTSEQACQATFALAKYYENNKAFSSAFSTYQSANLNKPAIGFNPAAYEQKCQAIIDTFDQACMKTIAPKRESGATPIFIIGLPRAGSTLVEQILSSHSQVEGTMELKIIPAIARKVFFKSIEKNQDSSGSMEKFTTRELEYYGDLYLEESKIYRSQGLPYFIDKLPPNFQHVGLIKKILPDAIIIDARRQPMSCGFGIFKQYFGNGHEFSYDLQHIALYYKQYLKLMTHWQQVLPGEVFHCQYEALVEDTESVVRDLLTFCHLSFEENCLTFYKNQRAVRTASSDQVRQPINRKGMDMWKNYQKELAPLADALGTEILNDCQRFIEN